MNTRKLFPVILTAAAVVITASISDAFEAVGKASAARELAQAQRRVQIDIWPRQTSIEINIATKNKAVEVALLAEPSLNFGEIDAPTVEFAGAFPSKASTGSYDANGDGRADRVYTFTTKDLKLAETDTTVCFSAVTVNQQKLTGCTAVKVINKANF